MLLSYASFKQFFHPKNTVVIQFFLVFVIKQGARHENTVEKIYHLESDDVRFHPLFDLIVETKSLFSHSVS